MQTTTHYSFNIVEGTDIVNPLTQLNPNFTSLDTELYDVSVDAVGTATEVVSGGVHALTRADATRPVFRFAATGDFQANDTFSVDGVSVTAKTVSGASIPAGAYVTGSAVIGILNGSLLTLIVSDDKAYTASDITTTGGGSVQDFIDGLTDQTLQTWTPNVGEDWQTFIARVRDNTTLTTPENVIRTTVDGVSGLIFHQERRTASNNWIYTSHYVTAAGCVLYAIIATPSAAYVRKYNLTLSTTENLSAEDAASLQIYGLNV